MSRPSHHDLKQSTERYRTHNDALKASLEPDSSALATSRRLPWHPPENPTMAVELADPVLLSGWADVLEAKHEPAFARLVVILRAAAERIRSLEGRASAAEDIARRAVSSMAGKPMSFTIEISPEGPRTIQDALAVVAEECGMNLEELLESKLGELAKK